MEEGRGGSHRGGYGSLGYSGRDDDIHSAIQGAYQNQDQEASRLLHDLKKGNATENHTPGGGYLKSAVYGGLDGIITTFATVTTVAGSGLAPSVILILGLAHLFADGLSMGVGDALSSAAEVDLYNHERAREVWFVEKMEDRTAALISERALEQSNIQKRELENYPDGEIEEMVELYKEKGVSGEDARMVVNTLAKYKNAFVDIMMVEELNLMPVGVDVSPAVGGVVTFISFVLFGSVPLFPFLIDLIPAFHFAELSMIWASTITTIVTLFILGAAKGKFVGQSWVRSGLVIAVNGSLAAGSGYLIGYLLKELGIPVS